MPFHISMNASYTTARAVFDQQEGGKPYVIYFISKNLAPMEYVNEKEFLVVIYSINKFFHYITSYHISIHTDHSSIIYLMNKPITNGKLTRW